MAKPVIQLNIRFDPEVYEGGRAVAGKRGLSMNEWVNRALRAALAAESRADATSQSSAA